METDPKKKNRSSSVPPPTHEGATRSSSFVDLGEDLLEETADLRQVMHGAGRGETQIHSDSSPLNDPSRYRSDRVVDVSEQLKSAEILMQEGLLDEAKKVLHAVLRKVPHHIPAREKLKELHELELKFIFTGQGALRAPQPRNPESTVSTPRETNEMIRKLERDLDLGLKLNSQMSSAELVEFSLNHHPKEMDQFAEHLEEELRGVDARQRMDVGIGFYEMGFFAIAAKQFQAVLKSAEEEDHSELRFTAIYLLAQAWIKGGQLFDAVICLEPVVGDAEIQPESKIHFIYLLGLALDELGKTSEAITCFKQVCNIDPHYRDAIERTRIG